MKKEDIYGMDNPTLLEQFTGHVHQLCAAFSVNEENASENNLEIFEAAILGRPAHLRDNCYHALLGVKNDNPVSFPERADRFMSKLVEKFAFTGC